MSGEETIRRSEWTGSPVEGAWGGPFDPGPWRHCHRIPGVWDSDNGSIAGKLCAACWDANRRVSVTAVRAVRRLHPVPPEVTA